MLAVSPAGASSLTKFDLFAYTYSVGRGLYFAGIAIISAATIILELALLRLFAVQQFYHFAFMAISLALLGAGASGSLLSVWQRRFSPTALCLAFGLATLGAYLVINYLPFDSFSIAWDSRQLFFLALYFLAAAVPFLFAGLLVGGELMRAGRGGGGGRTAGGGRERPLGDRAPARTRCTGQT